MYAYTKTAYKQNILTVTKTGCANLWIHGLWLGPRWAWGTTNSSFSWWCMAAFAPSLGEKETQSVCSFVLPQIETIEWGKWSNIGLLLVFWILRLAYIILYISFLGTIGDIRTFDRYWRINPRVVSRGELLVTMLESRVHQKQVMGSCGGVTWSCLT